MRIRSLTIAAFCGYVAASAAVLQAGQTAPKSVWDGVYTSQQAARGETQYSQHCAECHGSTMGGGEGPALVGDRFWTTWQESTVRALFDRISKNMPFDDDGKLAGTLPRQTYLDVVAHILSSNGFPAGSAELTPDTGVGVQIVRREGPSELPAGVLAQVIGCLQRSGSEWHVVKASRPARSGAFTAATAKTAPLGDREYTLKFVLTSLDRYAGQKVMASGTLIGQGGADGLNTDSVTSVSPTCE